jgi:hypothetical protein
MEQQTQPLNSAARMRLTRERRREGMRVVPLEAHDAEIDGLIKCGLLPTDQRGDREAIARAFGVLLDLIPPKRWPELIGAR